MALNLLMWNKDPAWVLELMRAMIFTLTPGVVCLNSRAIAAEAGVQEGAEVRGPQARSLGETWSGRRRDAISAR